MDIIQHSMLKKLAASKGNSMISLFIPTSRMTPTMEQNMIRFKNETRKAQAMLRKMGLGKPETEALLAPLERLLDDTFFWRKQSDGLAVYRSPDMFEYFRLPYASGEETVIMNRFLVTPLMKYYTAYGRFFILSLSQNSVRLYQATPYTINEVDIENAPGNIAEALRWDDPERQFQYHTGTAAQVAGKRAAVYHGQGVGTDDSVHKVNLLRYFQKIDRGLHGLLNERHLPLVLAGVEYLLPIYREANTYPYLIDDEIYGNPDERSDQQLLREALPAVTAHFADEMKHAAAIFTELAHTNRTSTDIKKILPAAIQGTVETLMIDPDARLWGRYDDENGKCTVYDSHESGTEELINRTAIHALLHGCTVHSASRDDIPKGASLAAIFRYSAP